MSLDSHITSLNYYLVHETLMKKQLPQTVSYRIVPKIARLLADCVLNSFYKLKPKVVKGLIM